MVQIVKDPLILVDGSPYLYRAYYAFPSLTNSIGEPTGVIYGVLSMLKSLFMQYRTSHVAIVFDTNSNIFRNELFAHYKSHRPPMPKDLSSQIEPLYEMLKAMGLPILNIAGVEADDVIGTLAIEAARDGRKVLISTVDKDIAQLVSSNINIINTISNKILGPEDIKLKFGVSPALIIDYLALMGDSSDNIPGIPGIGGKTAQALLQGIGCLEILYQQLDKIRNLHLRGARTIAAKLEQNRDMAFLSYRLATIKTDVSINKSYLQMKVQEPDAKALVLLFQRYEFKRWLNDLESGKWLIVDKNITLSLSSCTILHNVPDDRPPIQAMLKDRYQVIYDMITLDQWIAEIRRVKIFAFNIITDLDTPTANFIGICFSVKSGKAAYLPVGHNYLNMPDQLDLVQALSVLKPLLEDPSIVKIGQNVKLNYGILKSYNIELVGIIFDTMIESYVLDSVSGDHDNICSLADRYLHHTTVNFQALTGKKNKLVFNQMFIEQTAIYAAESADMMLRLHQRLWPIIAQQSELKKVFEEIEMPLVQVLSRIERTGVLINKDILTTYSLELTKRLDELAIEVYQLAEGTFNLSSNKQLREILYNKHKLPVLKKTPGGVPSTSEEVLAELALDYPLPKLILKYRCLSKLKSTYIDKLPQMINPQSKRIHTSYHQAITSTGRLSSSNPNLQHIPIRNNEGRKIRQAFIAPPDSLIVVADYSQIELRIMAHISHDTGLLNAFMSGQDIHCATAAEVFNISLDKVTANQRRTAKSINFGLIYGMGAFGLARQLSVSYAEAQRYINLYFKRYPGVLEYMENIRGKASKQGYVSTLDGRRLYLPDIHSHNNVTKKGAERSAINAPIQGTAADIIKRAMICIDSWLQKEVPLVHMIMQVHDELVFEVKRNVVEKTTLEIKNLMESCFLLDVPLQVNVGVGENWDQAQLSR